MSHATVSVPLDEFEALKSARDKALADLAAAQNALVALRAKVGDGDVPKLLGDLASGSRELIKVLRFALSNLSPEFIKNWSSETLRAVADFIPKLPDKTADDETLEQVCRAFANDVDEWDRKRKTGEVQLSFAHALEASHLPSLAELQKTAPKTE